MDFSKITSEVLKQLKNGDCPENRYSVDIVCQSINTYLTTNKELDDMFLENTSAVVHQKWLERNYENADAEEKLPYLELSEEVKEKDRHIVKLVIQEFNKFNRLSL